MSSIKRTVKIFVNYNRWCNRRIFDLRLQIGDNHELMEQLNHIHVMDCLWLHRLNVNHHLLPPPYTMDEHRFFSISEWYEVQSIVDQLLDHECSGWSSKRLAGKVEFLTMADGVWVASSRLDALFCMFNHQSLHRGEILSMLKRSGVEFGQSDLLPFAIIE